MSFEIANENAYQAALVTEQRGVQGRQDAIDVLKRLLDQMGNDPLIVKAKENLAKILANPEIITDEVFGNIMSKTGEVLDTNYDQQVQQVLGAARSKGISGPALQITLQKAKEQRAVAIAGAYRDALIERSKTGLETNLTAINATSALLNNLFNQQRVATEDLANVMREVVPAPFRNSAPDLPSAGVVPNQDGTWKPVTMDFSQVDAASAIRAQNDAKTQFEMLQRAAAWRGEDINGNPLPGTNATTYGTQPNGQPGTKESFEAANAAADRARAAAEGATIPLGAERPSVSQAGPLDSIQEYLKGLQTKGAETPVSGISPNYINPMPTYPTGVSMGAANLPSPTPSTLTPSTGIQSAVSGALSGLSGLSSQIASNFTPSSLAPTAPTAYPDPNVPLSQIPGTNIQTGGGAAAVSAGQRLVSQYGEPAVIGTTSGHGVRYDTTPTGSGRGVTAPYTGPVDTTAATSSATAAAQQAENQRRQAAAAAAASQGASLADQYRLLYGGATGGVAGAAATAAKTVASTPASTWWDAAKKVATAGPAGLGAALVGMFK